MILWCVQFMTGVEPLEAPRLVSLMLVLSPAAAHGLDQDIQHTAAETRTRRSESVARRHGSGTELQAAGNHLPVSSSPSCKLCTREAVCCVYRSQSRCGCLWWNPSWVTTRQCQAAEVTAHTAAHGGHGTRLRQQPPQPPPAPLFVTEDRGCRGMMATLTSIT